MSKEEIIKKTDEYVESKLSGETTGHDYFHVNRVRNNALMIAKEEGGDVFVIELAALLHDISDWKMNESNHSIGPKAARDFLESLSVEENVIKHVCEIIENMSFRGGGEKIINLSKEGRIVQDADRLDALGAIGIARAFASGHKFNQEIYNPDIKPLTKAKAKEYEKQYVGKRKNTTLNHFYEKILLLKERMNTQSAKAIAESRHKFMENYLKQFFDEWQGIA